MKILKKLYWAFVLAFLYMPIFVMIAFSFNQSKSRTVWTGFTLKWYVELFKNEAIIKAFFTTLIVAVIAATVATVLGTIAAVGIDAMKNWEKSLVINISYMPVVNPDIITGISLMLMFVFVGRMMGAATSLNFLTLLIAHVTFCTPYVILQVLPKLQQMDKSLPEAAMDLGCTPIGAFLKVELPEILPGIITGAIMAFTLSLDDFVISYFTSGNGFETLPIRIYGMTKKTVTPKMYALATIIFFVTLTLLLISNFVDNEDSRQLKEIKKKKKHKKMEEKK